MVVESNLLLNLPRLPYMEEAVQTLWAWKAVAEERAFYKNKHDRLPLNLVMTVIEKWKKVRELDEEIKKKSGQDNVERRIQSETVQRRTRRYLAMQAIVMDMVHPLIIKIDSVVIDPNTLISQAFLFASA
eukprot:Gregarina_sp_Poly_1__4355@NODE_2359_length_2238_cov_92_368494_g1502_i0_p2_GENE_NODE_2359_length_2238_cov_92_368494_g1502_i0NODE_2359_length_2238_cov_92_368494_g1502_i0_p2_ORF_typecomplete_len130_score14_56DUF1803/PF08820_10/0_094_NODE_2359_length_2238_cov_92_368494_g1502_i0423812